MHKSLFLVGAAIALTNIPLHAQTQDSPFGSEVDLRPTSPDDVLPTDFEGQVSYHGFYSGKARVGWKSYPMGGVYDVTMVFKGIQVSGTTAPRDTLSGESAELNPGSFIGKRSGATCTPTWDDGTTQIVYCGRTEYRERVNFTNAAGQKLTYEITGQATELVDNRRGESPPPQIAALHGTSTPTAVERAPPASAGSSDAQVRGPAASVATTQSQSDSSLAPGEVTSPEIRALLINAITESQKGWTYQTKIIPNTFTDAIFLRKEGAGSFYRIDFNSVNYTERQTKDGVDAFVYNGIVKCLVYYRSGGTDCWKVGSDLGDSSSMFDVAYFNETNTGPNNAYAKPAGKIDAIKCVAYGSDTVTTVVDDRSSMLGPTTSGSKTSYIFNTCTKPISVRYKSFKGNYCGLFQALMSDFTNPFTLDPRSRKIFCESEVVWAVYQ